MKAILFALLIYAFVGCSNDVEPNVLESDIWNEISNHEWSASYGFAGEGYYFYEENGKAMCMFMIYGSGLPIIHESHSEVTIDNEDKIIVNISIDDSSNQPLEMKLELKEGKLYQGDKVYEYMFDRDPRSLLLGE